VADQPSWRSFKPAGIPLRELETVELQLDELEALKQAHLFGRTQEEGANEMGISRSTFARILERASRKVTDAIVNDKGLIIQGGPVMTAKRIFKCFECGNQWEEPFGTGRPDGCPKCRSVDIARADSGPRGVCGCNHNRKREDGTRGKKNSDR